MSLWERVQELSGSDGVDFGVRGCRTRDGDAGRGGKAPGMGVDPPRDREPCGRDGDGRRGGRGWRGGPGPRSPWACPSTRTLPEPG